MILFSVIIFLTLVLVLMAQGMRIVAHQQVWVVQRLGRFKRVLQPGLFLRWTS